MLTPLYLQVRTAEEVASLTEEELSRVEVFSPLFAYPIFGEEETIFGYRNLEIQVCSSARKFLSRFPLHEADAV